MREHTQVFLFFCNQNLLIDEKVFEVTNKILEIISNPKKAKIITESAYKIVKENFDYRLNMRRLEKIMEESIKNSQNH
mgnify:CR=1 FL=1